MSHIWRSIQDTVKSLFTKFDITENVNNKVLTGLATVGGLYLASYLVTPLRGIWRHVLRPRRNLTQRYGGNWALVTGASYGLGKEYCI